MSFTNNNNGNKSKREPLLFKTSAATGNECYTKDQESCWKEYEGLTKNHQPLLLLQQSAPSASACTATIARNTLAAPTAAAYVKGLLEVAPEVTHFLQGKLAVVTGVTADSVAFYIAQELATSAGMHVIVLGKSMGMLNKCISRIQKEASGKEMTIYRQKYNLAAFDSITAAAEYCTSLAHADYNGQVHVLVNQASVGTDQAKLTADGVEYNTGCNFVATHYFTQLLLPLLRNAATATSSGMAQQYKPRVILAAGMSHALGRKFQPDRLAEYPMEGGAPEGYIVLQPDGSIQEFEPPNGDEAEETATAAVAQREESGSTSSTADGLTKKYWNDFLKSSTSIIKTTDSTKPKEIDLAKVGTQVGRSKMAVVADAQHLARLYPELNITSHHTGSPNAAVQNYSVAYFKSWFRLSPSQGARAALRAALDPAFDTVPDLQGAYLHCDGNPWTPMEPIVRNTRKNNELYSREDYAKACYQAAEDVIAMILPRRSTATSRDKSAETRNASDSTNSQLPNEGGVLDALDPEPGVANDENISNCNHAAAGEIA